MKRQNKYPETATFHYYNANPKNRITTDCVTRAICTALEIPYNQAVIELAQMQCETGYDACDSKLFDMYLQSKGWLKHKQPRKSDNTKYTGKEYCNHLRECPKILGEAENNPIGRIVANIGGNHTVAIVNAKVYDTWDSTNGCIGNYWTPANQ